MGQCGAKDKKKKLDADLQEVAEKMRAQVTRAEWQCV